MKLWAFLDFVDGQGENVIQDWLQGLAPSVRAEVKAKLNTRIQYLEVTSIFGPPYTGLLHGECAGLFEIKFKVKNVQYRPLACYGPEAREVTLLFGAIEKSDRLEPPGACSTALNRKALIDTDRRYVCPHDFR